MVRLRNNLSYWPDGLSLQRIRASETLIRLAHSGGVHGGNSNKKMVPTLPARSSFCIIARHKGLAVASASFCRSGRGWAAHFRRYRATPDTPPQYGVGGEVRSCLPHWACRRRACGLDNKSLQGTLPRDVVSA